MTRNLLFGLLSALLTTSTASAGILYAIDDSTNTLLRIDPNTAAITTVGSTGVATGDFGDLTYNPIDGLLYWVPGRGNNNLYTVDPNTGVATLVGSHGINDMFGLAWDTFNNVLYADSYDGNLYTLDAGTGAATVVGGNGIYPGGLMYTPGSDVLYLLQAKTDDLYMVDRFTGGIMPVAGGALGVSDNGITYDADHNTYWVASSLGSLFQYDISFSSRTTYSYGSPLNGIVFVPSASAGPAGPGVPEPGSLLLLGGGLVALSMIKRRRG